MAMNKTRKRKKFARREKPEFEQKLLDLARVTRVVKGGRRFRFRATVVIGNRKGKVGVGVGKGTDVSQAIQKGFADAKKKMITVELDGTTITHDIEKKLGSARIILKSAKEGRGIIAGGAVRVVVSLLGVRDIVSKSFGTSNKLNVARATIVALSEIAPGKGIKIEEAVMPKKISKKHLVKPAKKTEKSAKPVEKKETAKTPKAEKDDLTKIEGIGPKIAELFATNSITTYAELADADVKKLATLLEENKLGSHDPGTWSKQAKLARDGEWNTLKKLQEELDGGK